MQEIIRILLIEDEDFDVRRVKNTVKFFERSMSIEKIVSNGKDAINIINANQDFFDIVIMDYQIAGGLRGEDLIQKIKLIDPSIQIIVITKLTINITDFKFASSLMNAGAFWYCTKYPVDIEDYIYQPTDFTISIFNAFEKRKLHKASVRSNKKLEENIEKILEKKEIIGDSAAITNLKNDINRLAESDLNILITGPSGTGKELIANNIHYRSKRKYEDFVVINCGSIPSELIESELFGYEKGAFTGATGKKAGLFELADRGTIFLDEVGELPQSAQVKLLRVIQEGEIEKIGRTKKIHVDVRIIAATNKRLEEEVQAKQFREDLYYRLNVIPVEVPPLVNRKDDIELLCNHFLAKYSSELGKSFLGIDQNALEILLKYEWQGNVRELKNVMQRLIFYSTGKITIDDVNRALPGYKSEEVSEPFEFNDPAEIIPLREMERKFRYKYFNFVRSNSESDAEAAKKLHLAPPNFYRMCKELGLK